MINVLIKALAPLVVERMLTKSSAIGVVPAAATLAIANGQTPLDAGSLEGLIVQFITAAVALYCFIKKEAK